MPGRPPSSLAQLAAFGGCLARYATTVTPIVAQELRRWQHHAEQIPDPVLREAACTKLRDAASHAQIAAMIATVAPRRWRPTVVTAQVALEVMYDYLDTLTEQPHPNPLANGFSLYESFLVALGGSGGDFYRLHPHREDGGYLEQLVAVCRLAFLALPAARAVEGEARRVARLCGEAQTRTHAIDRLGVDQLALWARANRYGAALAWWEVAAGWCAAVLAIHALIAAAATRAATPAVAAAVSAAYLPISALTTMLDSLTDRDADATTGSHRFVSYYRGDADLAAALASVATEAVDAAALTENPAHDAMTVAGSAAFYCSGIGALPTTRPLLAELSPVVLPILAMFWLWRTSSRLRH